MYGTFNIVVGISGTILALALVKLEGTCVGGAGNRALGPAEFC